MKPGAPALVNAASRQCMLAERIARLYAQVGRDVLAARARRALSLALREFDEGVRTLLAAADAPEVRENYRLLELLWADYRPHLVRTPGVDSAAGILERHEELAWVAAKGARLARDGREPVGAALREAGDARLHSQVIGRLHFFTGWGTRSRNLAAELRQSNAAFRKSMDTLEAAARAAPELAAELQLAQNQYSFLGEAARRLETNDPAAPLESIAKTCDNILEVLDRVAKACEGGVPGA